MNLPLGKKPLTRTTTFTLPPGFSVDGAIGTLTGVLDLREGLDAEEATGVFALESVAMVRAGGTMAVAWSRRRIHSANTVEYRFCKVTYIEEFRGGR